MTSDDLNAPLGRPPAPDAKRRAGVSLRLVTAGAGVLALSAGAFWLAGGDNVSDGRARAIATIEKPAAAPPAAPVAAARNGTDKAPTGSIAKIIAPRSSGAQVESASGVRVVRRDGEVPGALILKVPDAPRVGLTPAPDQRLVQRSKYGLLPVEGRDGSKAFDVYARPLVTSGKLKPSAPRLSIVVGGMGLNAGVTEAAIQQLPAAVTLAFAPYGDGLPDQVARAREEGHEVILQVPMEPFNLEGPGPGPHMLRAAYDRKQMKEHLHWHMGRFPGYIGIGNFLGAKFTADANAFGAVIEEVRSRGLMYFDDGSSPRSLAAAISGATNSPFAKADVMLDASRDRRAVTASLEKLFALAVQQGHAIGFANGLPDVIAAIAPFAERLEKRGVALAPLSAIAVSRSAVAGKR